MSHQFAQVLLTGLLALLILAEIVWSRQGPGSIYDLRESLANACIAVVNGLQRPITLAWGFWVMTLLEPLQIAQLPETSAGFLATFVIVDFAYYWYHRLTHALPVLWALHHTHHSSPWMNLTTAIRLNWLARFVTPLFFAPLVLFGLSSLHIAASLALGLVYQFFLHTQAVGRVGLFEGLLLNTPSAHRVHHGSNPGYIDKNFAGVFIVWDRLFGTYVAEQEPVEYGTTTGFLGHNPLRIQFQPLSQYIHGNWQRERDVAAPGNESRIESEYIEAPNGNRRERPDH